MKADEVPADEGFAEAYRRVAYAVGEDGRYQLVATPGWNVETTATAAALEEQDRMVAAAFAQVRAGRRSPLAYHLARKMFTPALLAEYAGVWSLRTRWHLRPFGFARMPLWLARRYAECLQMELGELVKLPEKPESML